MDLISVAATGIRTKLINDLTVGPLVLEGGVYKVFLEAAEGQANMPYIVMHHIWGGDQNNAPSQSFDITMRVDCIAPKLPTARTISGAVRSALHRQTITYPDGWEDWARATLTGNYLEPLVLQGVQFWATGPFVRVRASKTA